MERDSTDPSTDPSGRFPGPSLAENELEQLLKLLTVAAALDTAERADLLTVAENCLATDGGQN